MACCGSVGVQRGVGVLQNRKVVYVIVPRDDFNAYDEHSQTYETELEARVDVTEGHVARAVVV